MAASLLSRCRAYLDPGAVNLSAQKHVFARVSLPPERHYESDCGGKNSNLQYDNGHQSISRTPQGLDISQQTRQGYAPMLSSVNAQVSNGCGTLCPSAFPRTTSFQDISDPARSDVWFSRKQKPGINS